MDNIYVEAPVQAIPENEQRMTYQRYIRTLSQMGKNVSHRKSLHTHEELRNQKKRRYISLPAMILTSLVVFDKIVQFSTHSNKPECSPDLWLQIITTVFAFAALILVAARDFMQIDDNKEKNSKAADRLQEFFYTIDTLRNISKGSEGDRIDIINSLQKQYANIINNNVSLIDEMSELHFSTNTPKNSSSESSSRSSEENIIECKRETGMFIDELSASNDEPLTTPRTTMNIGYQLERMKETV